MQVYTGLKHRNFVACPNWRNGFEVYESELHNGFFFCKLGELQDRLDDGHKVLEERTIGSEQYRTNQQCQNISQAG